MAEGVRSALALVNALFCQSVRKQIAAMIAVLDGVDLLVLTGGIGHHPTCRRKTIQQLLRESLHP